MKGHYRAPFRADRNFNLRYIFPVRLSLSFFFILCLPVFVCAETHEAYEGKTVEAINVQLETLAPGKGFNPKYVTSKLKTKVGDPFSQTLFDQDLKMLSEEYDRVIPSLAFQGEGLAILIKLWQKPLIRSIHWEGNRHFSTRKLQKELGIKPDTIFSRATFNKAFNSVKEFYIKHGFFEAILTYSLIPVGDRNEVDIIIHVQEGRSGRIEGIDFTGLTKSEETAILEMINTKKYNLFTSWMTGAGIYHEEMLQHDKLVITDYLQNQGYADVKVAIEIQESTKTGRLRILIHADRGELFHFGAITFSGNKLFSDTEIQKVLLIKEGEVYSPEKIRDTAQRLRDFYGKKGYIEADVRYTQTLSPSFATYAVHYDIEENEEYRVGLIRVLGNTGTATNVILRESLLVPGEVFDSRKLKATEERLQAMGYFKSVNVYAVRSSADNVLGSNYRDVIIEVEEMSTGTAKLNFGASTLNQLFIGLDFIENNFDYRGLFSFWREGPSVLRGGGEYFHAGFNIGGKDRQYLISWLDPYFRDSLWRLGFDLSYNQSQLQSTDYLSNTFAGTLFANHPLTQYWTVGTAYQIKNTIIHVNAEAGAEAVAQEQNSGLINSVGTNIAYDSTNSPYKPSRGMRSNFDVAIADLRRHHSTDKNFPYLRTGWINTLYYSPWRWGTFKLRAEFRFIFPFGVGTAELLPISERYFSGGETTVRGYRSFSLGPKYQKFTQGASNPEENPTGGISYTLGSIEYLHHLFKIVDAFVFFDGGSISLKQFNIGTFNTSTGLGLRIDIGNRMPIMVGYGWPLNPSSSSELGQQFFFAMGAQF